MMDELAARGRGDAVRRRRAADASTRSPSHVGDGDDRRSRSAELSQHYDGRGIELVERGGRWHFQTAPDLAHLLRRDARGSRAGCRRAAIETLAIIAYHEPVSRAEIEAIRGVQISKGTLDVLMEAGWVRPAGRREVPGPAATLCDDAGLPDPFRAGAAAATCRASTISRPPGCSIRSMKSLVPASTGKRRAKTTR